MNKMERLVRDFGTHEFSSGSTAGKDYRSFQTKYKNMLKEIIGQIGGELIKFNKNHYCFSAFVKRGSRYAYLSVSDVRFFPNAWKRNILVRTAKNEKDFSGGSNNYTSLEQLGGKLNKILGRS